MRRILVSGATSRIGYYLLKRLEAIPDYQVVAISRRQRLIDEPYNNVTWAVSDVSNAAGEGSPLETADELLHCGPLWILPEWLSRSDTSGLSRVIAFGSTSRYSKIFSPDPAERSVAEALRQAEDALEILAAQRGFRLTIFRPTLIYGDGLDRNVAVIARLIERFGFFPIIGAGAGKRMPVHAEDLAEACLLAINNPATFNKSYNLSGAEVMTYREMVERIFLGLDRRSRIVRLPMALLHFAIYVARILPRFRQLTPEMAHRMEKDLVFDHMPAVRDFGYSPRGFRPNRKDLIC